MLPDRAGEAKGGSGARGSPYGLVGRVERLVRLALLQPHQHKEIECIEMVGHLLEQPTTEFRGFNEPPDAVLPDCLLQDRGRSGEA
ncbi:MAG TPA: hypothetical protein VKX28_28490 [Xanthobacteraceae bacterium]|nr:hypothetical protein [Xanthobacteraceae bacterium]